jgi:hypothetical protein
MDNGATLATFISSGTTLATAGSSGVTFWDSALRPAPATLKE